MILYFETRISVSGRMAALAACLATACVVAGGTLAAQETRASIKNVLLIVSDDLRANALGCYGDPLCQTPHIDKLASRGLLFTHSYCQGTWCAPSRTSFMFSRYEGRGTQSLGEHFRKNGFYSARVGKIFHMRVPGDIIAGTDGEDIEECWTERFNSQGDEAHTPGDYACLNRNVFTTELAGRQSTKMPHRMFVSVSYQGDGSDQPDHKTATKTIELLREHSAKPFFIAAGFVRPHYPMVAPKQYFDRYRWEEMRVPTQVQNDLADIPKLGQTASRSALNGIDQFPDNQKRMWAAYYAAITFMDDQVGRILDEVERLGLHENTAVVFTSDHGYHLGDHTFWQKSNVHEEVIRVPLIISAPGYQPGRTDSIAELVDLYPTLSELVGVDVPADVQGLSLVPILKDPTAQLKEGALSFSNGHSWRTNDWAYMRYNDGSEELYDMQHDPEQITNLAGDQEHEMVLERLRTELLARLENAGIKRINRRQTTPAR
ncbi:sulfatase [Allorhodopirellula heiligendammensis]|uniref:Arylsulfatase n=1 Tax=Allorhodopirellula heiligendammensis TaxID=2714739 RepID=A0A5C6BDL3_9BACT|nr:sulfatase [Allorhodopirellula heiligendammensis]TWU09822.1 Arylsulfatase [Allorhodopirellula heiligendammensis]